MPIWARGSSVRTFLLWLSLLTFSCSSAFANCGSEQASCTAGCVVGATMAKQFGGGNDCVNNCLTAANACEAREEQQRQAEEQQRRMEEQRRQAFELKRQQAAQRQAQQERDAKEAAASREKVQQAGEVAQRVAAETGTQHQFDTAMEKGMQALDQKGYISAEFQFKTALKIRPNDLEAKAGLLRAFLGAVKPAAALTYANDQLSTTAPQPPEKDGRSAYFRWLEVLADNGLVGETERGQLERIYPFANDDPASAAAAFPKANPKSAFLRFVLQISIVIPAIRAEYEDRRRETEAKLQAAVLAKAKAQDEAAAKLKNETEAKAKSEAAQKARMAQLARKRFVLPPEIPQEVEDVLLSNLLFTSLPDSVAVSCVRTAKHYLFDSARKGTIAHHAGLGGVLQEAYHWEDMPRMAPAHISSVSTLGGLMPLQMSNGYMVTSIQSAEGRLFPLATGNKFKVVYKATKPDPAMAQRLQCEVLEPVDLKSQQPNLDPAGTYIIYCEGSNKYKLCSNSLGLCPGALAWYKQNGRSPPDFSGSFAMEDGEGYGQTVSCSRR